MKTKDLIALLQKEDPSGEEEVCVDNADIYFVSKLPAYYDGCFQVLKREDKKKPYYDVVGIEIKSNGYKIKIHTHDLESALIDDPEMPVYFDSEYSERHEKEHVENLRKEFREIKNDKVK